MSVLRDSLYRFHNTVRQVSRVIRRGENRPHTVKTPEWHGLEPMEPRLLLSSSPLVATTLAENLAPNIILMIGDGMGPEQIEATAAYLGRDLSFESLPYQGEVTTRSASNSVTDSAAAATAMATGQKVNNGVISVALPGDSSDLTTSLEINQDLQKMVGLVTTTYMTHATPSAFGAHDTSRNNAAAIAADYLNQTRPNVMLGGGGNGLSQSSAEAAGYTVATSKTGMLALDVDNLAFVSGQFGTTYMPYEVDGNAGGAYATGAFPDLSEMTALALDVLDNDPDGFFLMVEGGLIDQACHSNDLQRAIGEVIEFEETVAMVYNWAQTHGNTLVIVTADHETGGLSVTADNGAGYYPTATWSTTGHTGVNVPIYAYGPGAEAVSGVLDNTDIFTLTTPSTPSSEVTVSFQQNVNGYAGTVDTQLSQANAGTGHGSVTSLTVDTDEPAGSGSDTQGLLRFDNIFGSATAQIPTDKPIVSAQLQLEVTNSGGSIGLYRMLSSWLDSATWNSLVGGVQADGVEAMATADVATGTVATGILTVDVTAALQAWQADSSSNFGWAFLPTSSDGVDFYSAEGTTPPQLIVTYSTGTPNQAPVAADDSASGNEDGAISIAVLANDTDADGDSLAISSVTQAANGSVVVNTDGTITYRPQDDFNGSDSFVYTVSDGRGGYDVGVVSLTVAPIYDAPVAMPDGPVTTQDTPVTIHVLANDSNPDRHQLTLTVARDPDHGTVAIDSAEQTLIYTPADGFTGGDSFAYTISDGLGGSSTAEVAVTVNPGPQTLYATGEFNTMAAVSGSYLDTAQNDSVCESLTEVSQRKKNMLDHTWVFTLAGGDTITFSLNAWCSNGDDSFLFQYSTDRTVWTSMFAVSATADNAVEQTYSLPAGLSGTVYIQAVDANRGANEASRDTLYVDAMSITVVGGAVVLPTVTVEATDASAGEGGNPGAFTITRSNTNGSLTVYYALSGTAQSGVDYSAVDDSVVFSDGEASKMVTIVPVDDAVTEAGGEAVILTISSNAAYDIGVNQTATLTIADNDGSTSFVDYQPISQDHVYGTVVTSPLAAYEVLAEELDGKRSCLDYTWTFNIATTDASTVTFNVEAWHDGTEDNFLFQYSVNRTDWNNMLTVTKTSDDNTVQTSALPSHLTGTIYIRVLDTNRAVNKKTLDRLYIDKLFIRCT